MADRADSVTAELEARIAKAEHDRDVARGVVAPAVCGASAAARRAWEEARTRGDGAFGEYVRAAIAYDADPNDPSDYEAGEHDQAKTGAEASLPPLVDAIDGILDDCPVDDRDLEGE